MFSRNINFLRNPFIKLALTVLACITKRLAYAFSLKTGYISLACAFVLIRQ